VDSRHAPVLLTEILTWLNVRPGGVYVDCTTNGAGHAHAILEKSAPDGRLVGLDMDSTTLDMAAKRLDAFGDRATLVHSNFADLTDALERAGVDKVDGLLADLGLSSNQLDRGERGFSFQQDGPVDMRMDPSRGETADELIERLEARDLGRILRDFGDERFAMRIAVRIKERLEKTPFTGTRDLAQTIADAIPKKFHPKHIHAATRSFQALRIAVNGELDSLSRLLEQIPAALKVGGRVAIISYHSLEDRLVRHAFKDWERDCICPPKLPVCQCDKRREAHILTRKPIEAQEEEISRNPRSRSAKLRVAERT
jgi:16S rRNA (cytosine1402-N4)-methyltransferase